MLLFKQDMLSITNIIYHNLSFKVNKFKKKLGRVIKPLDDFCHFNSKIVAKLISCDICKKNFKFKSHQLVHKRSQTGEKHISVMFLIKLFFRNII